MKIPNWPGNKKFVDEEGNLTKEWRHTLEQLFQELQKNMSNEGHIAPSQSTANLTKLGGTDTSGAILYNEDTDKLVANIAGVIKEIQTV